MLVKDLFECMDDSILDMFSRIVFYDTTNNEVQQASILILAWCSPLDMYSEIKDRPLVSFGLSKSESQTLVIRYEGEPKYTEVNMD